MGGKALKSVLTEHLTSGLDLLGRAGLGAVSVSFGRRLASRLGVVGTCRVGVGGGWGAGDDSTTLDGDA